MKVGSQKKKEMRKKVKTSKTQKVGKIGQKKKVGIWKM